MAAVDIERKEKKEHLKKDRARWAPITVAAFCCRFCVGRRWWKMIIKKGSNASSEKLFIAGFGQCSGKKS